MKYLPDDTIPPPLYDALVESSEEYGTEVMDYLLKYGRAYNPSVTTLNKPTQQVVLMERYRGDIYVDPLKDCWHSLMGNIVHWVLEKNAAKNPRYYTELRMGVDLDIGGVECHIHGKLDLYDRQEEKIQDWKLTNANSMLYGEKTDYANQLHVLSYIMRKNKYSVQSMEDIFLFPHLDKTKFNNPLYPRVNIKTVPVEIKSLKENRAYIVERVLRLITERKKKDKDLTPCTDHERWVRGNVFKAFTRKKGKAKGGGLQPFSSRAAFVTETKDEILKVTSDYEDEHIKIVEVKGEPKLCGFCPASPFCRQYQGERIAAEKAAGPKVSGFHKKRTKKRE